MKAILISEERLNELLKKCLADMLTRGPDPSQPELPLSYKTVVYYVHQMVDGIKNGQIGL